MLDTYKCKEFIKELALDLDKEITTNYPTIKKKCRLYYISYYHNRRTILYVWLYRDKLGIFFKDKENILKSVSKEIPKGITIGFNRRYEVKAKEEMSNAKKLIKQYFSYYAGA